MLGALTRRSGEALHPKDMQ
ncbi:hypothetical protein pYptb0026 (plasmid) [Yersinia pseudotuberculosis IP 32953]|uniref:Uncharacterized protein n=1 Tax=Yersinia pseudotuberculosis serotype I (strain IP32953) TaxID=273123 RepID=Q663C8_YERPS|nr:hypothetical protein pYptb0026 [Yersinia pseudotuberculosis IP 32953]